MLGEDDLVRIGVLVLVLPLAAAAVLAGTRLQLRCTRRMEPRRVPAGSLVRVTLEVENGSRRMTPTLLAEDTVTSDTAAAAGWSHTSSLAIEHLEGGASRRMGYVVRPPVRGVYDLGPLVVLLCDPFGFCELPRRFSVSDRLVVTPEVVALPTTALPGQWSTGATTRLGGAGGIGDDDLGTRPYRYGDELRRVHWRTTARLGELSVRREEQPRQGSVTLALDTRAVAFPPGSDPAEFETAISTVASIAVTLTDLGVRVRVITLGGRELGLVSGGMRTEGSSGSAVSGTVSVGALLDVLAGLHPDPEHRRGAGRDETDRAGGPVSISVPIGGGSRSESPDPVVAVLGRFRPDDLPALPRPPAGAFGLALLVGAEASAPSVAQPLQTAGWRTAGVPRLSGLPLAWSGLTSGTTTPVRDSAW